MGCTPSAPMYSWHIVVVDCRCKAAKVKVPMQAADVNCPTQAMPMMSAHAQRTVLRCTPTSADTSLATLSLLR